MLGKLELYLKRKANNQEIDYLDLESCRCVAREESEYGIEEDYVWDKEEEFNLKKREFENQLSLRGWVNLFKPSTRWVDACNKNPKLEKRVQKYLEMKVQEVVC